MGIMRLPRLTPRALFKHSDAARQALEICAIADSMAQEAMQCVDSNEERLYELIERRDEVLQSLAEHLVSLRLEKHAADSPLIASIEVKRRGDVRRAKLYYLRQRSGKSARIKEKLA